MIARKTGSAQLSPQKLICKEDDIREGVSVLRRQCSVLKAIHDRTGEPPLRRYPADFSGLAHIIVGQQLSIASAAAIWSRLQAALGRVTAPVVRAARDETLVTAGLSSAKVRTLRALADAVGPQRASTLKATASWSGAPKPVRLSIARLVNASDEEVRDALMAVHGIGPWTADIFIMFCLGRADAWAAGDLALQVGVARAFGMGKRLTAEETLAVAERWRPWRGVAARLIWADYSNLRNMKPIAAKTNGKETANVVSESRRRQTGRPRQAQHANRKTQKRS